MLSCQELARALSRRGIRISAACDGDINQDGELTIANMVHVQVPTFGGRPRVIVDAFPRNMRCYPPRKTIAELADDIRSALDELPVSAVGGCSIH